MIKDPIVEEVRAIREEFSRKHNYDVEAIVRALRLASEANGRSLVSLPPKAPIGEDEVQKFWLNNGIQPTALRAAADAKRYAPEPREACLWNRAPRLRLAVPALEVKQ